MLVPVGRGTSHYISIASLPEDWSATLAARDSSVKDLSVSAQTSAASAFSATRHCRQQVQALDQAVILQCDSESCKVATAKNIQVGVVETAGPLQKGSSRTFHNTQCMHTALTPSVHKAESEKPFVVVIA